MTKKRLLLLGALLILVGSIVAIGGQVIAKGKEGKEIKVKDKDLVCDYAQPRPGCVWTNITPYPECGGTLVCDGEL